MALLAPALMLGQSPRFADPSATIHLAPERSYDVQHYLLDLTLDFAEKSVSGEVTVTLKPLRNGLKQVVLDSADLQILHVDVNGRTAPFKLQSDKLAVDLDKAYNASDSIDIKVAYSGHPRQGLYWVGGDPAYPGKPAQIWSQGEDQDSHYWFPCYDFPDDKATSDTVITVKKPFTAISNGDLVDVRDGGSTRTFHWRMDRPHSTYLTSVAAGDFEEYKQNAGNVSVEYYVPKGTGRETALRSFGRTPEMIQFFEKTFGIPYPYRKYAQIAAVDFLFGGMENVTATTQTAATLHDAKAQKDYPSESLVAHELAHQWWGDMVTPADWSHIWLSEGFATYFEALYTRASQGEDAFRYEMYQNAQKYFQEDTNSYRRPVVSQVYSAPIDLFDQHTYEKGGLVLGMIQYVLGDKLFAQAIHDYGTKFADRNAVTGDLSRTIAESTGKNLDKFFSQWLYHGGYPEYSVTWAWQNGRAEVTVRQEQMVDDLTPLFDMPVVIDFTLPDGKVQAFTAHIDKAEQRLTYSLPQRPVMVRFDPGNNILKTLTFTKTPDELQYQALHDPDVIGRIRAMHALTSSGNRSDAIGTLTSVLEHDSFGGARAEAATLLGTIHEEAALTALLRSASNPDSRVRRAVVSAIAEFPPEDGTIATLHKALADDVSYAVQAAAATALGRTRPEGTFDILSAAITIESHNDVVRRAALAAITQVGPADRVRPILLDWTSYGKTQDTRTAAISLLPRVAGSDRATVIQRLIDLLKDPWIFARESAINALGATRATEALPELQVSAERETDGRLRQEARAAIARITRVGN